MMNNPYQPGMQMPYGYPVPNYPGGYQGTPDGSAPMMPSMPGGAMGAPGPQGGLGGATGGPGPQGGFGGVMGGPGPQGGFGGVMGGPGPQGGFGGPMGGPGPQGGFGGGMGGPGPQGGFGGGLGGLGPQGGFGGGLGALGQPSGTIPSGQLPAEESYIENILRLNLGKIATIYMTFENNSEWNAKIFKGRLEAAGRDHVIISDPRTGMRFLLLMVNLDYITFDEELQYMPSFGAGPGGGSPAGR